MTKEQRISEINNELNSFLHTDLRTILLLVFVGLIISLIVVIALKIEKPEKESIPAKLTVLYFFIAIPYLIYSNDVISDLEKERTELETALISDNHEVSWLLGHMI